MARYDKSRLGRPISNYHPLPLNLIAQGAQKKQNELDNARNLMSGNFTGKYIAGSTDATKREKDKADYAAEMEQVNAMLQPGVDDVEGATRKAMAIRAKYGLSSSGNISFNNGSVGGTSKKRSSNGSSTGNNYMSSDAGSDEMYGTSRWIANDAWDKEQTFIKDMNKPNSGMNEYDKITQQHKALTQYEANGASTNVDNRIQYTNVQSTDIYKELDALTADHAADRNTYLGDDGVYRSTSTDEFITAEEVYTNSMGIMAGNSDWQNQMGREFYARVLAGDANSGVQLADAIDSEEFTRLALEDVTRDFRAKKDAEVDAKIANGDKRSRDVIAQEVYKNAYTRTAADVSNSEYDEFIDEAMGNKDSEGYADAMYSRAEKEFKQQKMEGYANTQTVERSFSKKGYSEKESASYKERAARALLDYEASLQKEQVSTYDDVLVGNGEEAVEAYGILEDDVANGQDNINKTAMTAAAANKALYAVFGDPNKNKPFDLSNLIGDVFKVVETDNEALFGNAFNRDPKTGEILGVGDDFLTIYNKNNKDNQIEEGSAEYYALVANTNELIVKQQKATVASNHAVAMHANNVSELTAIRNDAIEANEEEFRALYDRIHPLWIWSATRDGSGKGTNSKGLYSDGNINEDRPTFEEWLANPEKYKQQEVRSIASLSGSRRFDKLVANSLEENVGSSAGVSIAYKVGSKNNEYGRFFMQTDGTFAKEGFVNGVTVGTSKITIAEHLDKEGGFDMTKPYTVDKSLVPGGDKNGAYTIITYKQGTGNKAKTSVVRIYDRNVSDAYGNYAAAKTDARLGQITINERAAGNTKQYTGSGDIYDGNFTDMSISLLQIEGSERIANQRSSIVGMQQGDEITLSNGDIVVKTKQDNYRLVVTDINGDKRYVGNPSPDVDGLSVTVGITEYSRNTTGNMKKSVVVDNADPYSD